MIIFLIDLSAHYFLNEWFFVLKDQKIVGALKKCLYQFCSFSQPENGRGRMFENLEQPNLGLFD